MAVTPESFRQTIKGFADPLKYSDIAISALVTAAVTLLNANRWDPGVIDYGTCLFVAHHLVLQERDIAVTAAGGIAGSVQGVIQGKQVDKVQVSYNTQAVVNEGASYWNMTTYGIRFYQLARMMGAGGIQIGQGPYAPGGGAWPGFGWNYSGYV